MIIDALQRVSTAQALTATAASTDFLDLGIERRIGTGETMCMLFTVNVALAGTSPTINFTIQSDDNTSFSSAANIVVSPTFSALAAGTRYALVIPPGALTERYLRVNYTLGGTSPTITLTAGLQPVNMLQNDFYYADAITIS